MFRRILLTSTALVVAAGSAFAADLPSRKAPPVYIPPPPIFTWTGVYVGGQVGYAFGRDRWNVPAAPFVGSSYSPSGVIGGAHVGYNYQVGSFVAGLEGDVNGASYGSSATYAGGVTLGTRIPIDGSVRGRIGFAYDRVLFYATGGAAFAGIRNTYALPGFFTAINHTRVGWTAGAGIEYAITNNWSLRAEYRYTDYGRYTDVPLAAIPVTNREIEHRVQAGFSYKFDMFAPPGPVVAKY